jgi:hypothetical protein
MCLIATVELRTDAILDTETAEQTAPKKRIAVFANMLEDFSEEVTEVKQTVDTIMEGYGTATTGSVESQTCSSEDSEEGKSFEISPKKKIEHGISHF